MSSPQRALRDAETPGFPRTSPAYCAVVALAALVLAGLAMAAAVPSADAAEPRSMSSDRPAEGQFHSPEQSTAPQPEASPSTSFPPIGPTLPIVPVVTKPDTGASGHGEGGAIELALAFTGGGQDAAWRPPARGLLTTEHSAEDPQPTFDAILLLPLAGGLMVLVALVVLVGRRILRDDVEEPGQRHPLPPTE